MVKFILTPKGIETQFIKRVSEGNDGGLVRAILEPPTGTQIRVCVCEDGRMNWASSADTVRRGLMQLASNLGLHHEVVVDSFTFVHGDETVMTRLLMQATVFYFAGIHNVPAGLRYALAHGQLAALLKERVQYNQCAYFGVCGGALVAGTGTPYPCWPCLDLLDGVTVRYDSCVGAGMAEVLTGWQPQVMQITAGVGLAFVMTPTHIEGCSFPVIKNHQKWAAFAARNTTALCQLLARKAECWSEYRWRDIDNSRWYVNLRGYILVGNNMYVFDDSGALRHVPDL